MSTIEYLYKKYIRKDLIARYCYNDFREVIKLEDIKLKIFIKNVDETSAQRVIMVLKLLEGISGEKPMIKHNKQNKKVDLKYQLNNIMINSVILRKKKMYKFLDYLTMIVMPSYIKRYGIPLIKKNWSGEYHIYIEDMSIFYDLGELSLVSEPFVIILNFGEKEFEEVLYYLNSIFFLAREEV